MEFRANGDMQDLSKRLIRQADPVRVATADAIVSDTLHIRLSYLIGTLSELANDVKLWRILSQADPSRAAVAREQLSALGDQPWLELLIAGGYSFPPPPPPDKVAASLSWNVRHAVKQHQADQSDKEFRETVLYARKRLLRLIERLVDRLDLSGSNRARSDDLPLLAKIGCDVAIDSAAAVAVPQILGQTSVGVETLTSGGWALAAQMITHAMERSWSAISDYRELRKPLPPALAEDPVLQVLALLQSTVQQARSLAVHSHADPAVHRAIADALTLYTSMMRKTLTAVLDRPKSWPAAELLLERLTSGAGHGIDPAVASDLSRALDHVWSERTAGAHGWVL